MRTRSLNLLLLLCSLLISAGSFAQGDSVRRDRLDTAMNRISKDSSMPRRLQEVAMSVNEKLREKYYGQLAQSRQERVFANLRAVFLRTNDFLKTGLDTASIARELRIAEDRIQLAGEGIFTNQGTIQTSRNLATSSVMLTEIGTRNEQREKQIDNYLIDLETFRTTIDSLASDSFFLYIPADTSELKQHLAQLSLLGKEIRTTDSSLNTSLKTVRSLKTRATIIAGNIRSRLEEIEAFREQLSQNSFDKETTYLWEAPKFRRPMREIISFSIEKMDMVMFFYLRNHANKILVVFFLALLLLIYLRSLKKNIIKEMGADSDLAHSMVLEKPGLAAILISIAIGQFFFPTPPFSFYAITWLIASIALTILLIGRITSFWMKFWITAVVLSVIASGLNLILQASRPERLAMVLLSLTGTIVGLMVLFSKYLKELKEKRLVIFLWITVALELIATFANILGRYNFAKGMMATGFFGLVVGIQLLWTVKLIHEIFDISAEAYREDEKKRFYIDFEKVGSEVPSYLYLILGIGWFILITRNFYIYTKISGPFIDFFNKERGIGVYSFTLSSILLFVAIIFLSGVISKLVSYFADNKVTKGNKRSGLGSWMLLIRIAIFSSGLFLAFAATGIPMDRIAIVFGALSVGIGFGLQTVVNNLVSGLIIAFEKPINVGDVVEIGGRGGTMKSIGFRSSVITTFDGSEVIIPNGDLLNQHLINWTMNDNPRRVEILVGVNYGTNVDETIQLIHQLISEDERIRKFPESFVLVNNFGNSSIDLRILFWVSHFTNWQLVKSDLMQKIKNKFDEQGIEIPYPQMVLHTQADDKEEKQS